MDTRQVAEAIHKGVDTLMEAVPPLVKALDEVAKIHPFISRASPFFGISVGRLMAIHPVKLPCLRLRLFIHSR